VLDSCESITKVDDDEGTEIDKDDIWGLMLWSDSLRLDLEADLRIEGVSKLSRAFGSSSLVYRPIAGR
jgi:hypothetical protein